MSPANAPAERPSSDALVPLEQLDAAAPLRDLRSALASIAPPGVLRYAVQDIRLLDGGREVGRHRVIEAILDVEGNLVPFSLLPWVESEQAAGERIASALQDVEARLDTAGIVGRDATEVVLDADGGAEVRVAFDLEISPEEIAARPPHPGLHDAAHHVRHRAPDLDELRDRVQAQRRGPAQRLWARVRGALTRDD